MKQFDPSANSTSVNIKKVPSKHGKQWFDFAYQLFKDAFGIWLAIACFVTLLQLIPLVNQLASLLLPFALGGLMLGCQQLANGHGLKFDHLFEGLKKDAKQLLILSLSYGLLSVLVVLITMLLLQALGYNLAELLPANYQQMSAVEFVKWFEQADPAKMQQLFKAILVGLIISLTLMIPVLMALWFAPALVVIKKQPAIKALILSIKACRVNMMPMTIYGLILIGYSLAFFFVLSFISLMIPLLVIPGIIFGYLSLFSITVASLYTSFRDVFGSEENTGTTGSKPPSSDASMLA